MSGFLILWAFVAWSFGIYAAGRKHGCQDARAELEGIHDAEQRRATRKIVTVHLRRPQHSVFIDRPL